MKEHSTKLQPIAEPVWLVMRPSSIPLFIVTPKRKRKSKGIKVPAGFAVSRNAYCK